MNDYPNREELTRGPLALRLNETYLRASRINTNARRQRMVTVPQK
jgi:hypothetical protein